MKSEYYSKENEINKDDPKIIWHHLNDLFKMVSDLMPHNGAIIGIF